LDKAILAVIRRASLQWSLSMAVTSSLWHIVLAGGLVTLALFMHGDRALAETAAECTASVLGVACLWSFWEPR